MPFRSISVAALLTASVIAPAQAELLKYELTGAAQATFFVDSQTIPTSFEDFPLARNFNIDGVSGSYPVGAASVPSFFNLRFYSAFNLGGIDVISADFDPATGTYIDNFNVAITTDNLNGGQLYTGPVEAPTLTTGTFHLIDFICCGGTYTLTVSAVPEPATWGSMATGLCVVGAAGMTTARRRQRREVLVA